MYRSSWWMLQNNYLYFWQLWKNKTAAAAAAAASKTHQSCPTLCDPIDGSPPGSPIPGILQARTLEWVAISFSNAWKWKVKVSRSVMSDPQRPHGLQPTRLLHLWDFPGKGTRVGCHFLLQGIFPAQGSNLGLPHCRQMLYHLSHQRFSYKIRKEQGCPLSPILLIIVVKVSFPE